MRSPARTFDESADGRCAGLIARQYGVISRAQALKAGANANEINYRIRSGKWAPLHPCVYLVSGAGLGVHARLQAALLYVGAGSALSHRSAASLLGIGYFQSHPVEVLSSRRDKSSEGISIHMTKDLPRVDVTKVDGLAVTTVLRTLADLGAVVETTQVEDCLDEALRRRLTTTHQLRRHLERLAGPGRRGAGVLRKLLDERGPGYVPTESRFETRLFRLLKKAQLPVPAKQLEIVEGGDFIARVDFAYPDARVALEADSYAYHSHRGDWEADKRRRALLVSHGWRVLETTWRGMVEAPQELIDNVARALGYARLS